MMAMSWYLIYGFKSAQSQGLDGPMRYFLRAAFFSSCHQVVINYVQMLISLLILDDLAFYHSLCPFPLHPQQLKKLMDVIVAINHIQINLRKMVICKLFSMLWFYGPYALLFSLRSCSISLICLTNACNLNNSWVLAMS